jgi:hypothetical protein
VQTFIFPFHAAYQRMFAKPRWRSPADALPHEADDVMLWAARRTDGSPDREGARESRRPTDPKGRPALRARPGTSD